ncbi:MarR family transcriptional regulator [Gordoniibacillus kamchatkensis]|uniref:MarR family transcriptional regulator n=1 Tax=Gordoniibacillus kamchatkensis TaxID=1590651 RepID=A0ABR5AKD2_9BACL|nr:MarR family transcriptional regulator [Paenibacillus sp. VKM B-2647]KIL40990.1 MarR family transcriptional regulator [Paenibacillus sp. VKM B-2647]
MTKKMMDKAVYEQLADFRYRLRKFIHFSEQAARRNGLTPQSHQLLLAIMGYPGRDYVTPTELAERLQLTHHACVGLIDRCERQGLVERKPNPEDGRSIYIHLSPEGRRLLETLSEIHWEELNRIGLWNK